MNYHITKVIYHLHSAQSINKFPGIIYLIFVIVLENDEILLLQIW